MFAATVTGRPRTLPRGARRGKVGQDSYLCGCPGRVGAMKAVNYKPQKVDHCQPYSPDRRFPDKISPAALIPRSPILHSLFPVPHSPFADSPFPGFSVPDSPFPDSLFPIPPDSPVFLFPIPQNFSPAAPIPRSPIPHSFYLRSGFPELTMSNIVNYPTQSSYAF